MSFELNRYALSSVDGLQISVSYFILMIVDALQW